MHSSPMANQNALLAYENPAHLTTAYTVTTTTTTHTQTQAAYTLPYDLSSTGNAELWGTETLRSSGSASARQPAEMIVDAVRIPEEFGVGGENDGLLSCGLLPEAVPNILLDLEFPCPFRYLTEKDMGPEQKPWTRLSWAELPQHPTQGPPKQNTQTTHEAEKTAAATPSTRVSVVPVDSVCKLPLFTTTPTTTASSTQPDVTRIEKPRPRILIEPFWAGTKQGWGFTELSNRQPVTYEIRIPAGPAKRTVSLTITTQLLDGDREETVEIVNALQQIHQPPTPLPRKRRRSQITKSKPAKLPTQVVVFDEIVQVTISPESLRLRPHCYRFEISIPEQGLEFSVRSRPTITYSHITQHAHKAFKIMLPYHFPSNRQVTQSDWESFILCLKNLNDVRGYKDHAFRKLPFPSVQKRDCLGKDMPLAVDFFLASCEILDHLEIFYDLGCIHDCMSITDVKALLTRNPIGSMLLHIDLVGLVISWLDGTTGDLKHHHVTSATPEALEVLLVQAPMHNVILSHHRAIRDEVVAKKEVLALFAEVCPTLPGYSLLWERAPGSGPNGRSSLRAIEPPTEKRKPAPTPARKKPRKEIEY